MGLSVRLLQGGDEEKLDTFLVPHTPFVYFMRSNAKNGGLSYAGKVYQAEYFGAFNDEALVGVLTHSWLGNVQVFVEDNKHVEALVAAWLDSYRKNPREVLGFLGEPAQMKILFSVLNISPALLRRGGHGEMLFSLSLNKIAIPPLLGRKDITARRAQSQDLEALSVWRHDYNVEAVNAPPGQETYDKGRAEILRRIDEGDLFVLEKQGQLVSFCGVGGFLPDWKCVGPVWTPPDLRSLGYARAVTAAALLTMREEGATHAVLFTDTPQAEKVCRAIGFERIGDFLLDFPMKPLLSFDAHPDVSETLCK